MEKAPRFIDNAYRAILTVSNYVHSVNKLNNMKKKINLYKPNSIYSVTG